MKRLLIIALLAILVSCETETITGIEYRNMLDATVKVDIYLVEEEPTLLETIYSKPLETFLVELPAGSIKMEYTPPGCWRVLPDIIELKEGEIRHDSLWFALPLWN